MKNAALALAFIGGMVAGCSDAGSTDLAPGGSAPDPNAPAVARTGASSKPPGPGVDGGAVADAGFDATPAPKVLTAPVAALAAEVAVRSPGTQTAIAVLDLKTGD